MPFHLYLHGLTLQLQASGPACEHATNLFVCILNQERNVILQGLGPGHRYVVILYVFFVAFFGVFLLIYVALPSSNPPQMSDGLHNHYTAFIFSLRGMQLHQKYYMHVFPNGHATYGHTWWHTIQFADICHLFVKCSSSYHF